jgi:hypothetical protein
MRNLRLFFRHAKHRLYGDALSTRLTDWHAVDADEQALWRYACGSMGHRMGKSRCAAGGPRTFRWAQFQAKTFSKRATGSLGMATLETALPAFFISSPVIMTTRGSEIVLYKLACVHD